MDDPPPGTAVEVVSLPPGPVEALQDAAQAPSDTAARVEALQRAGLVGGEAVERMRNEGQRPGRVRLAFSHRGGVSFLGGPFVRVPGPAASRADGDADPASRVAAFLRAHTAIFSWAPADGELELMRVDPLPEGGESIRVRQLHEGYRVADADLLVHLHDDGSCSYMSGFYLPGLPPVPEQTLSESEAFEALEPVVEGLVVGGRSELVFVDPARHGLPEGAPTLAWELRAATEQPADRIIGYVDASTGEVFGLQSTVRGALRREVWDAAEAVIGSLPFCTATRPSTVLTGSTTHPSCWCARLVTTQSR